MRPKKTIIAESTGNVFSDLGFDTIEAQDLKRRSDLMIALREQISSRSESQEKIAAVLGVTQPRISDLMRGKIHLFSLDTLVAMLGRLGAIVAVSVQAPVVRSAEDTSGGVSTTSGIFLGTVALTTSLSGSAVSAGAYVADWMSLSEQTASSVKQVPAAGIFDAFMKVHYGHVETPVQAAADTQHALAA